LIKIGATFFWNKLFNRLKLIEVTEYNTTGKMFPFEIRLLVNAVMRYLKESECDPNWHFVFSLHENYKNFNLVFYNIYGVEETFYTNETHTVERPFTHSRSYLTLEQWNWHVSAWKTQNRQDGLKTFVIDMAH